MTTQQIIQKRTDSADVYIVHDAPQRDNTAIVYPAYTAPSWLAIAFVKTQQDEQSGIKYLINRYPEFRQPSVFEVVADTLEKGCFSIRPYQLGQNCDGSIDSCVMALFCNYCKSKGFDPLILYRKAYQEHDGELYWDLDFKQACEFGDWQGVAYPDKWDESAIKGLLTSLREINNHQLAMVVADEEGF